MERRTFLKAVGGATGGLALGVDPLLSGDDSGHMEEQADVDLAVRFTLSQPGVVAAIPPSFLDLLDRTIEAGKTIRPITPAEVDRLREIAAASESVFQKEEAVAHWQHTPHRRLFPGCPHEGEEGMWA